MTTALEKRLTEVLAGSVLASRLPVSATSFLELRHDDRAAQALDGPIFAGLARLLASQAEVAGFLSHRPQLLERIADADADTLAVRARELAEEPLPGNLDDLEARLNDLRILRREETCIAACLDLGGVVSFAQVSEFLAVLAEAITQRALDLARHSVAGDLPDPAFSVIGMGKVAGREFTYHSDLDLIFLYQGSPEDIARVSRIGQRTISYLTTMTGAGVAYAVDTRLRPSGQQGMLVTSFSGFEEYQRERAETWEHLALLRARAIAGGIDDAQQLLDRVRRTVVGSGRDPWPYVADLRGRVHTERASESEESLPIKTGRGGLMDVDFLAAGGVLEGGVDRLPDFPSVPSMLRGLELGESVDRLVADYATLRIVEARCRWVHGRAVEELETGEDTLAVVAELVEPGLPGAALLQRIAAVRERVRAAFERVIAAGTIGALAEPE